MRKSTRNLRQVTEPPARLPNQQDGYELVPLKATTPDIKKTAVRPTLSPSPKERMHADGNNHENPKAVSVKSLLKREPDEGEKQYPTKVHRVSSIPEKGYFPPGAKIKKCYV